MRLRSVIPNLAAILSLAAGVAFLSAPSRSFAAEGAPAIPAWLSAHIGEGAGQIAGPVLLRARAFYYKKLNEGAIRNGCYFAMDATRPNDPSGSRFYTICESNQTFWAISAGHGSGRDLEGSVDFSNGRRCAKNFGNALDSDLTAGGGYVTAEAKTSFKGYYRASASQDAAFLRTFLQFDGEGETANARERAIGGHASVVLKGVCLRKEPHSPYADGNGYVPFGKLVEYPGGRSNGCTSWSPSDAEHIFSMVKGHPTTVYIYPDAADIDAVSRTIAAGQSPSRAGLYWNASCLSEIRAPKYWRKDTLEPILAQYKRLHPAPPPQPTPLCPGQ